MKDSPVETLSFERSDLDLGYVQPTAVCRRVVKLEQIEIGVCFIGWEESIEGRRVVGVEVVEHNPDAVRIRVVLISELDHPIDPFGGSTPVSGCGGNPSSQRFGGEVNHLRPVSLVVAVDPRARSRPTRERVAHVIVEFLAGLVETDDWTGTV